MSDPKYSNIGTPEDKVIEECAELIKAISKARRFGYFNWHPDRPKSNNLNDIKREMDDCIEAFNNYEKHLNYLSHARNP